MWGPTRLVRCPHAASRKRASGRLRKPALGTLRSLREELADDPISSRARKRGPETELLAAMPATRAATERRKASPPRQCGRRTLRSARLLYEASLGAPFPLSFTQGAVRAPRQADDEPWLFENWIGEARMSGASASPPLTRLTPSAFATLSPFHGEREKTPLRSRHRAGTRNLTDHDTACAFSPAHGQWALRAPGPIRGGPLCLFDAGLTRV